MVGERGMLAFHRILSQIAMALILTVTFVGCAQPPGTRQSDGQSTGSQTIFAPKRFTAAIRGNPHTVYQKLNPRSNIPGIDILERLVETGLTIPSLDGASRVA